MKFTGVIERTGRYYVIFPPKASVTHLTILIPYMTHYPSGPLVQKLVILSLLRQGFQVRKRPAWRDLHLMHLPIVPRKPKRIHLRAISKRIPLDDAY